MITNSLIFDRHDDEHPQEKNVASDSQPRQPSGNESSLKSPRERSKRVSSQGESEDDSRQSIRRRGKRVSRRPIIASDEGSNEDAEDHGTQGAATSNDESDENDSDDASRGDTTRRTRSGKLRQTVPHASKKKPKTARSIQTIQMKGNKRVSL